MKKIFILFFVSFFCFLIFSRNGFCTQTYKVKPNSRGGVARVSVPAGTPHKPSKAAKINTASNQDEDYDEDEKEDENIAIKKVVQKEVRTGVKKAVSTSSKSKKAKKSSGSKSTYKTSTVKAYNRINEIGEKLLEANDIRQDIVFSLSTSYVTNASTDFFNVITINKGIIRYTENDDELAAVIAHEMGHVLNKDVKKSIGIAIGGAVINTASRGYGSRGTELARMKLHRNMEYAADIAGVDMMVNAGYNPLAMISLLGKISGHYFDFDATHPTGKKRILALYQYIENYYPQYLNDGYPTVSYRSALRVIGK